MKIVLPLIKFLMRSSLFVKVPIKGFPVYKRLHDSPN